MAEKFSISGELLLSAPSNLNQISKQIKKALSVSSEVKIIVNKANLLKAKQTLENYFKQSVKAKITIDGVRNPRSVVKAVQDALKKHPVKLNLNVTNVNQIADQISAALQSRIINIKLNLNATAAAAATSQAMRRVTSSTNEAGSAMENLGKQTAITIRRFGIYTAATGAFFSLNNAFKAGVSEAIEYQKQITKIRQVTGESYASLKGLDETVTNLSTSLGVSSKELLDVSQTLAQAGFSAGNVRVLLDSIAKSDLSPTFESMAQTAEGTIAVLNQFGLSAEQAGEKLDSLNVVAAKFAVESADLITAIRTAGGAFEAAGGSTEELLALFTSIRQTTRASASSIAVGLKTISTRLQRGRTQSFLKDLGIDLKFAGEEARALGKEGLFVGVYESIERISTALKAIPRNDPRFAQIAEELGGFRQIDKVIPLLTQFSLAERVRAEALRSTGSLDKDAAIAQESLANKLTKVREEFQALIREFVSSTTFQTVTTIALNLANALIKVGSALTNILGPLSILGLTAIRVPLRQFNRGLSTIGSRQPTFSKGGNVPGTGNKDDVNALLTPGEFVIRKKAVKKLGADRLRYINERGELPKFANGGIFGRVLGNSSSIQQSLVATSILAGITTFSNTLGDASETIDKFAISLFTMGTQMFLVTKLLNSSSPQLTNLNRELSASSAEVRRATRVRQSQYQIVPSNTKARPINNMTGQVVSPFQLQQRQAEAMRIRNDRRNGPQAIRGDIRTVEAFNLSIGIFTGVLFSAAEYLKQSSENFLKTATGLESIYEIESQRDKVAASGALSGGAGGLAVAGIGIPALARNFGLALNPGILLVGGALSVIAGMFYSTAKSVSAFDKAVKAIKLNRLSDELSKLLSSVEKGNISTQSASFDINNTIKNLLNQQAFETDPEIRSNVQSILQNSLNGLQIFIDKVTSTSSNLQDFNKQIAPELISFFAKSTGLSLKDFKRKIEENIIAQNKQLAVFEKNAVISQIFDSRIRSELALTKAIKNSVGAFNSINGTLELLNKGTLNSTPTPLIQNLESIGSGNSKVLASQLTRFASLFGSAGPNLVTDTIEASVALENLTSILLKAKNSEAFSGEDLLQSVSNDLKGLKIGDNIRNRILSALGEFGGPNEDVSKIRDVLSNNISEVLNKITNIISPVGSSILEANKLIDNELNVLANNLAEVNTSLISVQNRRSGTFDRTAQFLKTVNDRPNLAADQQILNNQTNFITDNRQASQIFNDLVQSQKNLLDINKQLANESDITVRRNLIKVQSSQILAIQKANTALDFLSDVSKRVSVAQEALTQERNQRAGLKSIAEKVVFGTAEEKANLARINEIARRAASAGTAEVVPEQFKGELNNFLSELGDTRLPSLGGASGNEIKDLLLTNGLKDARINPAGITAPSDKEKAIVEDIRKIFIEANNIDLARAFLEEQNSVNFITNLNTSFDKFLIGLRDAVLSERKLSIDQNISSLSNDRQAFQNIFNSANQLKNLSGGVDPNVLINSFSKIRDLINDIKALELAGSLGDSSKNLTTLDITPLRKGGRGSSTPTDVSKRFEPSDFITLLDKELTNIEKVFGPKASQGIREKVESGSFAKFSKNFTQNEFIETFNEVAKEVGKQLQQDKLVAESSLSGFTQANKLDGSVLSMIEKNSDQISQILGTLPEGTDFSKLSTEIEKLTIQIQQLQEVRKGFNKGGIVPGVGNSDSVPATLTPGEFVIRKDAVRNIGLNKLNKLNSSGRIGFNSGGLVQQQNISQTSLASFNLAVDRFLFGINSIADSLRNIPSQIEMVGQHKVEVVINGAQVFQTMLPSIASLVEVEINKSINKLIRNRFPEQGRF